MDVLSLLAFALPFTFFPLIAWALYGHHWTRKSRQADRHDILPR